MNKILCDFCGKPVENFPIVTRFDKPNDDYEIRITNEICRNRHFDGRGPVPKSPDICTDCLLSVIKKTIKDKN